MSFELQIFDWPLPGILSDRMAVNQFLRVCLILILMADLETARRGLELNTSYIWLSGLLFMTFGFRISPIISKRTGPNLRLWKEKTAQCKMKIGKRTNKIPISLICLNKGLHWNAINPIPLFTSLKKWNIFSVSGKSQVHWALPVFFFLFCKRLR